MNDLFLGERIIPESPKKMNLREVGVDFAMKHNELWHSRLPITSHSNMIRNTHKDRKSTRLNSSH